MSTDHLAELIGESPALAALRDRVRRMIARQATARRPRPILIVGETGTGKGLLAQAIHRSGPRAEAAFVTVNCAAIPESLFEAELFGFERGAFTDARQAKAGLLETAHRGTLFLDEVGLMAGALQGKLLDALETGAVRRLGSTRTQNVDVWLLAASNLDLVGAVRAGRFREDLYHRLAVLTVRLPPLRERDGDAVLLAERFLGEACAAAGAGAKRLSADARDALRRYPWPGNVRELRNVMDSVATLAEGAVVTASDLALPPDPPSVAEPRAARRPRPEPSPSPAAPHAPDGGDAATLARTLEETGWNLSRTAARLGISRHTLRYRIELHRLRRASADAQEPAPGPPLPAAPTNLPRPLTRFVGRNRELDQVRRLVRASRLLTLTGAGGAGKTRLALESAGQLLAEFPDGAWLVELGALADPALVPRAAAAALRVRDEAAGSPIDTLAEALRDKRLLLVLDNCEHLVGGCAEMAAMLLEACPGVRILATSRQPLDVPGEVIWRVPSLALPPPDRLPPLDELARSEAVELFLDRAGHVQPGFSVTADNALAVAQICYRLDGMPLPIEMAAGCLRVLAVEQINARLHDRFRLLTGRGRNDLPRQHTLRATMDWSYDLLSADERCLLARLGVFAGPFSLEAAEGVCAGDGIELAGFLGVLTRLVDQSLVSVSVARGEARYRLLETVRAYAREKLEASGEERPLRARHQQWYRASAALAHRMFEEGAPEAGQLSVLERLEAEHANILAALAWQDAEREDAEGRLRLGAALWRFWLFSGRRGEGRECLERVLAETPPGASAARADALTAAGMLARAQGDYLGAAAHHDAALAMRQALGDPREIALSLGNLAVVAHDRGEYERATRLLEEALPLLAEAGSPFHRAIALNNLGRTVRFRGDLGRATDLTEESLRLFRDIGHRYGIAAALHSLADLAQCEGDLGRSATLYEESLALRRAVGHQPGIAISLNGLGDLARRQGDLARASRLCDESLALRRALGDRRGVALSLGSLARIARDQGDLARAGALCAESLVLHRSLGNPVGVAAGLETMAAVAVDRGEPARAAWLLGAAAALREAIGAPLPPSARQERDGDAARARGGCGDAAFASAWDEGRGAPMERAIAVAQGRDAGIGPAGA